ncbi:MAG: hypothetical protein RR565_09610 [Erysipelothrix sp.]
MKLENGMKLIFNNNEYIVETNLEHVDLNKSEDIDIYIYDQHRQIKGYVYFVVNADSDSISKRLIPNKAFILDIISYEAGLGSVMLNMVYDYLKDIGFDEISGNLKPNDKKEADFLESFYLKNGYNVSYTADRTSGKIKKQVI